MEKPIFNERNVTASAPIPMQERHSRTSSTPGVRKLVVSSPPQELAEDVYMSTGSTESDRSDRNPHSLSLSC